MLSVKESMQAGPTYGSSEMKHLKTCATIGLLGSSGLLRCSQSASLMFHPLYTTSSTNVLSLVDTRKVVTPGCFSGSEECMGRAFPGPARREAKFVLEVYGGPGSEVDDVMA